MIINMKELYVSKKISDEDIEKKEGNFFSEEGVKIYKNKLFYHSWL